MQVENAWRLAKRSARIESESYAWAWHAAFNILGVNTLPPEALKVGDLLVPIGCRAARFKLKSDECPEFAHLTTESDEEIRIPWSVIYVSFETLKTHEPRQSAPRIPESAVEAKSQTTAHTV